MPSLFVVFLFAVAVAAADLPDAPSAHRTPRLYWVLNAAHAGSIVADAETTIGSERMGCVELGNPELYGRRPERPRFYAVSAGIWLGTAAVSYPMVRSHSRAWRALGYGLLAWQTAARAQAAVHNSALDRKACQ